MVDMQYAMSIYAYPHIPVRRTEATEEAVKARCGEALYLHFACHGCLDARRGMEPALVLSLPRRAGRARENGFLQAYETGVPRTY